MDDYAEFMDLAEDDCEDSLLASDHTSVHFIVVRMKTAVSPRGRLLNMKSALFKVCQVNVCAIGMCSLDRQSPYLAYKLSGEDDDRVV